MPTIAHFFGIAVQMFFADHNPGGTGWTTTAENEFPMVDALKLKPLDGRKLWPPSTEQENMLARQR